MLRVDNVNFNIDYIENDIINAICANLKISANDIKSYFIIKKALDARKKQNLHYNMSFGVETNKTIENKHKSKIFVVESEIASYKQKSLPKKPIVVGFGPSGMFCALNLARMGFKPIVLEQGKNVEEREKDVESFWKEGKLDCFSNVQFGEGGAGTFSDGKLNTNLNSKTCNEIVREFYHFGAPKEILYQSKPHIGSDNLKKIVKNIRNEIIKLGGEIKFNTKFIGYLRCKEYLIIKTINTLSQNEESFNTAHLVLALGHSARDTFKMLDKNKVKIVPKPFAMGVRIEQGQNKINEAQYGKNYPKNLPNADYKLAVHLPNGRSVFTFCMCPGGEVVASSSGENEIVTNGMSYFSRNGKNANSAVLVNVLPEDFESKDNLAGLAFQEKYEKLAFIIGGRNYNAPCETVGSFLNNKPNTSHITSTYKPNITWTKIKDCLPTFVYESLKTALPLLNNKIAGFASDENLLIALESRSSCPITILRNDNYESSEKGIYPIGEGAGYAGGIVSSAIDGIKAAKQIYEKA